MHNCCIFYACRIASVFPLFYQLLQKRRDGNHTLMPVTAAIIHKSVYNKIDESFKYGDIELHQVLTC